MVRGEVGALRDVVIRIEAPVLRLEIFGLAMEFEVGVGGEEFAEALEVLAVWPLKPTVLEAEIEEFPALIGNERVAGRTLGRGLRAHSVHSSRAMA